MVDTPEMRKVSAYERMARALEQIAHEMSRYNTDQELLTKIKRIDKGEFTGDDERDVF